MSDACIASIDYLHDGRRARVERFDRDAFGTWRVIVATVMPGNDGVPWERTASVEFTTDDEAARAFTVATEIALRWVRDGVAFKADGLETAQAWIRIGAGPKKPWRRR